MWHLKTKIIPVVEGALGLIKRDTSEFAKSKPGRPKLPEIQKIVLTAHIMRKFSIDMRD